MIACLLILGAGLRGDVARGADPPPASTPSPPPSTPTPPPSAVPPAPASIPTEGRKEFAPGVWIDWSQRVVELEAKVVLREGPLELLACSPRTREHESILAVRARPMHVYQAMGLIGLRPGSPARYDQKEDRWFPPVGEALNLQACQGEGDSRRCEPVERWLLDIEHRRPVERVNWVFAGSRTFEDGRFGADLDGTVVCVVDFDSALITVGALHSADNELLWLAVNTEAIPPLGTPCTLLIRGVGERIIAVELAVDGTLRREGQAVSADELVRVVKPDRPDAAPRAVVVLRLGPSVTPYTVKTAVESLVQAGIDRTLIRIEPSESGRPDAKPAKEPTGG